MDGGREANTLGRKVVGGAASFGKMDSLMRL